MNEQPKQPKKPYTTPVLSLYGDIREITRNVGRNGFNDNGVGNGHDMTQP